MILVSFLIKNVAQFFLFYSFIHTNIFFSLFFFTKKDGHVHIVGSVALVAIITMVYSMYMLIRNT